MAKSVNRVLLMAACLVVCLAATAQAEDPARVASSFFKDSIRLDPLAAEMVVPAMRNEYRELLLDALDQWEVAHPDMPMDIWVDGFDFSGLNFAEVENDGQKAVVEVSGGYSVQAGGVASVRPVSMRIHLVQTDGGWLVNRPE